MTDAMAGNPAFPPPPQLGLRVGVTGARNITEAQHDAVAYELGRVITATKRHLDLLEQTLHSACYARDHNARIILLSPLAEGADRMAADAALKAGYVLQVITPFALGEYERDFKTDASLAAFRALFAKASGCLELDGARGDPDEAAAYEAAGELIVRNCDLLIAVWDGEEGRGRGGTEAIVRYAMSVGVPIWWINLKQPQGARLITGTRQLAEPRTDDSADAALGAYLRRLLEPPLPGDEQPATLLEHVRQLAQRLRPAPLQVYLASKQRPVRRIWRAHDWLIRFAAGFPAVSGTDEPLEDTYWYRMFAPADRRANDYGRRVRSAYVWVSFLTLASVALAACAPIFASMGDRFEVSTTAIEFLCLLAISALLLRRQWHEWHQRWRDYRRLAEFFRAQQALAPVCDAQPGWIRTVANIDFPPPVGRDLWVTWLVSAAVRGAPPHSLRFGGAGLEEQRERILDLVQQQQRYHLSASTQARLAEKRFRQLDELSFPVVVAVVAFKLLAKQYHWDASGEWLNLAAIVLPVLALNVASIRAATRLQLQADRSQAMANHMGRAAVRLQAVELSLPLASRDLATIAQGVAAVMQQDTEGRFEIIEPD